MAATHDDLLAMYATYLDERGYRAVKIPETTTKTPDLEVSGHENSYLNEFKSPDLLLDQALGLYKFATTNSKLLQFIHIAIKQFRDHDPSHANPWVITFVILPDGSVRTSAVISAFGSVLLVAGRGAATASPSCGYRTRSFAASGSSGSSLLTPEDSSRYGAVGPGR
ncbi:MAG TPA: hypothetical protein VHN16_16920 [Streptosporangiaceae bacterium]|nr:hypothetical protein [Streptosporangiaceae bacterium]